MSAPRTTREAFAVTSLDIALPKGDAGLATVFGWAESVAAGQLATEGAVPLTVLLVVPFDGERRVILVQVQRCQSGTTARLRAAVLGMIERARAEAVVVVMETWSASAPFREALPEDLAHAPNRREELWASLEVRGGQCVYALAPIARDAQGQPSAQAWSSAPKPPVGGALVGWFEPPRWSATGGQA